MADVLFIVIRLGTEVGEVSKQQHDANDQGDKQHNDLRPTARTF
jgi:hypothetical protein